MRKLTEEATEENIIDSFNKNRYNRNKDIFEFMGFLFSLDGVHSLALDGRWGSGKTFLIRQVQYFINTHAKDIKVNPDNNTIYGKVVTSIRKKPIKAYYFDAWKNDNEIDPLITLLFEIVQNTEGVHESDSKTIIVDIKDLFNKAINGIVGTNINILDCVKSDDIFSTLQEHNKRENTIKELLSMIIKERYEKIYIIIDELDRCSPLYTIKLLERVKHYFGDERICFIFAVNREELQHTINSVYGVNLNATRYLNKIFDHVYSLPPIEYDELMYHNIDSYRFLGVCEILSKKYALPVRETLTLQTKL